ncbi:MAG: hypothetical protein H6970_10350 [Gammaproteobacteria bacterium]|nr:hypothetical protein [Gammaproteobacteria bacterium]MCP5459800.1 hypothetical protein [Gammaproteobacteria bacterium]
MIAAPEQGGQAPAVCLPYRRQAFQFVFQSFRFLRGAGRRSPQVMLVLDTSNSLWGKIDNKETIVIAQGAVGNILENWDEATDRGLRIVGQLCRIQWFIP